MGCLANASKAASGTGVGPGIININLFSIISTLIVYNTNTTNFLIFHELSIISLVDYI
jgi:hypothetical protein